jgi:YidC/Oxa1 family membrane protein insertase
MSLFDTLIVQPIFNLLMVIYGILPGQDFGISLIIFTVIVRLVMWPLVKKQLHQTKVMRAIQPELKKIKVKAKGNKQLEGQLMMELYRERGVNPFSSIGLLLVQLPIFIALFRVIQIITSERDKIASYTYGFVESIKPVANIINDKQHDFNESLLNIINLTQHAVGSDGFKIGLFILAIIAAYLQYVQSKQVVPEPTSNKRLRDMFKESATGKDVDQQEMSALVTNRMIILFPAITFFVALYLPGALVLYYAVSSGVAVIQQHIILNRDEEELEDIADEEKPEKKAKKPAKAATRSSAKDRASKATEATVITPPKKKRKKRR